MIAAVIKDLTATSCCREQACNGELRVVSFFPGPDSFLRDIDVACFGVDTYVATIGFETGDCGLSNATERIKHYIMFIGVELYKS